MMRLFSASLLSLLLCASLANAAEKPLIVASDATWPPIEMLDENKNVVGYSIDYLKAVAKEAGLTVEFRNTAWDGIFAALESRQADIIASSVTITEKRKKAMGFSNPYCEIRQAVVVPTGVEITSLKDLDGKKVGGRIGTTGLVETLPKAKSKAIVKTYDEVGLALEDLAKGNIDAVVCDDPVAKFYANKKQEYKGKLHVAFITEDVEYYGFAVRQSDKDLVKKLNEGIKAVKEKGLDKQIVETWIGR
ncbi:MAG: basic amino acid ABC transporter substrate-binding protein [Bilophila sp.]